jgi:hypothetical protein
MLVAVKVANVAEFAEIAVAVRVVNAPVFAVVLPIGGGEAKSAPPEAMPSTVHCGSIAAFSATNLYAEFPRKIVARPPPSSGTQTGFTVPPDALVYVANGVDVPLAKVQMNP